MPIKTKRWDDPPDPDDGFRLLICRYRPRGVAKADETWNAWNPDLGPSRALHAAVYGKAGALSMPWQTYLAKYRVEMRAQQPRIAELAARVKAGETITLLCSSACTRESRCHRSILKAMIEAAMESPAIG